MKNSVFENVNRKFAETEKEIDEKLQKTWVIYARKLENVIQLLFVLDRERDERQWQMQYNQSNQVDSPEELAIPSLEIIKARNEKILKVISLTKP